MIGVLRGLEELRDGARRPHGNLKPSNILLATRGKDATDAQVALCDPASTAIALKDGEATDRNRLGQLIHQLVTHEAPADGLILASPAWGAMGPQGAGWQELCEWLLGSGEPGSTIDWREIEAHVMALAPSDRPLRRSPAFRPAGSRKTAYAVAACAGLVVLAFAAVAFLEARTRREFCQQKSRWLGRFAESSADPQRRKAWEADADLSRVLAELDRANLPSVHCEKSGWSTNPLRYWRVRSALAAARQITTDLAPERWKQLANAWDRAPVRIARLDTTGRTPCRPDQ